MHVLHARNVNDALAQGVRLLRRIGNPEDSRNGPVLRAPCPVTTVYAQPCERVLFAPWRDANPFFHLIEAMWVLAGRNDLKALTPYAKNMAQYSDDGGVTQPGAYGHRWRVFFQKHESKERLDQLNWVVRRLQADPGDRRVVIQMWSPEDDIYRADHGSKDVPCNLTALPYVSEGRLHLTIFCRSNDIIWGAYGANAVHFSFLLEYLAGRLGLAVGMMIQVSNNWHGYDATMPGADTDSRVPINLYLGPDVRPMPLFQDWESLPIGGGISEVNDDRRERLLQEDLLIFFEHGWREAATKARWPFLRQVVVPMAAAHEHWRKGRGEDRYNGAREILEQCRAADWQWAAMDWVSRRHDRWVVAADDGVSA